MSSISSLHDLDPDALYFIPLGGCEQFGINCNLYAFDGSLIMVDCGLGFADQRLPGIDIILPDLASLDEYTDNLAGIVVTHAHEDHIGALPYLWPNLRAPIYCTKFSAQVLKSKFSDFPECRGSKIKEIAAGKEFSVGPFNCLPVSMAHSIPETVSLVITANKTRLFHSADWNLDERPVLGTTTDKNTLIKEGKKGISVYLGDSTNSLSPGYAGSESNVEDGLEKVIGEQTRRVAVTLFSSNISRIQSIARASYKCGRDVALVGRSLHKMVACARNSGYLKDIPDFVPESEIGLIPKDKITIIMTGSQGEAKAAMSRIARGDYNGIYLESGDTAIFSAREIPGNEKAINEVKNNLKSRGVKIIDPSNATHKIHVSGHPYQEEIKKMLEWIKPETVIPVHGETMQITGQAEIAGECGVNNTLVPSNGSVIKLAPGEVCVRGEVPVGILAVEPSRIISIDHKSISERRKLQYTGAVHASVVVNGKGKLVGNQKISTMGLFDNDVPVDTRLETQLATEIKEIHDELSMEERLDDQFTQEQIRIGLRRFVSHMLGIKPKVTVHLIRV